MAEPRRGGEPTNFARPSVFPAGRLSSVIIGASAAIAAVILAMIVAETWYAQRSAAETGHIVESSHRSVRLLARVERHANRLAFARVGSIERSAARRLLDEAVQAYKGLAAHSVDGKRSQELLEIMADLDGMAGRESTPAAQALADLDRLVEELSVLDEKEAHRQLERVRELHRNTVLFDYGAAALAFLLLTGVAITGKHKQRRYEALLREHMAVLEQRNRELDAFTDRVAHDLQAPLNPIRGYSDILLANEEPPEQVRFMASRIRLAADQMWQIISDMLALSKMARIDPGSTRPGDVVVQILQDMHDHLRGAEVTVDIEEIVVACPAGILTQIVRNLVSNAIKFSAGDRRLELRITAAKIGAYVEVAVEDNGIGMDDESAAHAFDLFYRSASSREVPGYGIGLAIVKRAAEALGGSCALEKRDQGTRVSVRLPASG